MIEIGSVWETSMGTVVIVEKITDVSIYVRNARNDQHTTCVERKDSFTSLFTEVL